MNVLSNLMLDIDKSDFVTIFGDEKSGKTTLFNIVSLLDSPDNGQYIFLKHSLVGLSDSQLSKLRAKRYGLMFQKQLFSKELTVIDNIILPTLYSGMSKNFSYVRAKYLISSFGLKPIENQYPISLSPLEIFNLQLARALVNNPCLIIVDEPCDGFLLQNKVECIEKFKVLNKKGITILLLTKDRDIWLSGNKKFILSSGTLSRVTSND